MSARTVYILGFRINFLRESIIDRHLLVRFCCHLGPPEFVNLLVLHLIGVSRKHPLVLELALDLPDAVFALNVIDLALVTD